MALLGKNSYKMEKRIELHELRSRGSDHMIASFFDTKTTIEFADWIVAELKRAVPPASVSHKKKHAIRAREGDENIARRVAEFTRTTRLNIYKKARLAARVREGMSAHGYPKAFVDSFSFELIARIRAAAKSRTD
jgi:hypothetical protein